MEKIVVPLVHETHWKWRVHRKGKNKMKISGKMKKWLKKNTRSHMLITGDPPPVVCFYNEEDAILFKLTWL